MIEYEYSVQRQQPTAALTKRLLLMFGLVLLTLLLIGCGTEIEPTVTLLPATAPPTSAPANFTPVPATTAPIPTPTSTVIPCSPTTAMSAGNEWDYVVIGDSIVWGFLTQPPNNGYIGYLEQDLDIQVRIHNWQRDAWSSEGMLIALRTDEKLRQDLCDAEVVIFEVPRYVFQSPGQVYISGNPGACGGTDNQDCLRKALNLYKEHVDAIIAEIVSLRSPSNALVRTFDAHTYWPVKETKANGTFEGMNYYWQAANDYLIHVATEYQIPVARVNEAFNGPNGDEDPLEKGYTGDDFRHPSRKGDELMAELMRALGYEYAP